jgi:hypothetical protein
LRDRSGSNQLEAEDGEQDDVIGFHESLPKVRPF